MKDILLIRQINLSRLRLGSVRLRKLKDVYSSEQKIGPRVRPYFLAMKLATMKNY